MDPDQYISMNDCKESFLYKIHARNAKLGIYCFENKSFKISRYKFNSNFIFEEFHWDTGEPFGTVKPIEEIEEVPPMTDEELLIFLNNKNKEYFGEENPMQKAR